MHPDTGFAKKIILIFAVTLAVWTAGAMYDHFLLPPPESAVVSVDRQIEAADRFFADLLEEASATTRLALDSSASDAFFNGAGAGLLAGRLEGVGLFHTGEDYFDWEGTPAEIPRELMESPVDTWRIDRQGLQTRLYVQTGPDETGRSGSATYLLHSKLGDFDFQDLMPSVLSGNGSTVLLLAGAPDRQTGMDTTEGFHRITAPDGSIIATLSFVDNPETSSWITALRTGMWLAVLTFTVLLFWMFPWRTACRTASGLLGAVLAIAIVRWALIASHFPGTVLTGALGSSELFGTGKGWGLGGSPADLFLTAFAILLSVMALRTYLFATMPAHRRSWAFLLLPALSISSTACIYFVSVSIARDSRIQVLRLGDAVQSPGHIAILLSLGMLLLATAELVALIRIAVAHQDGKVHPGTGRAVAASMIVALAAFSSATILTAQDRLALDRLQTEFGPQVLEQSSRRVAALRSTLVHAASHLATQTPDLLTGAESEFLAYDLWSGSALFRAGYKSSLTILDLTGSRISHFGFDLPPLEEEIAAEPAGYDEIIPVHEKPEPVTTAQPDLIHAHLTVLKDGEVLGTVVGHVIDEPDNLPFLPGSRPYLGSLGVGGISLEEGIPVPEYVLYTAAGVVRYSTLNQPPPWKVEFDKAALEHHAVHTTAVGARYRALPILEMNRLHLLLLPSPTMLERLSGFVRLALTGLLMLALIELAGRSVRKGGLRQLIAGVRGSYYRKLAVSLLLAFVLPLVGLSLFLTGYFEQRGESALLDSSVQMALVAQRVVEDYAGIQSAGEEPLPFDFTDDLMSWLRRVVGQEIHLYEDGVLAASSKRELFASGLLLPRLPGHVYRKLLQENQPPMVDPVRLGRTTVPVAYAPISLTDQSRKIVIAVPLILQQQTIDHAVDRLVEILLLTTVFLAALLVVAAALLARMVAHPVRALVSATHRIASGNYETRLQPKSRDEIAELVLGFNSMASALASQRADLIQRKDYTEALLRNATTGVISTDHTGRIVTINPAAIALLSSEGRVPEPGRVLADEMARSVELAPLAEPLRERRSSGESHDVDLHLAEKPVRLRLVRVELPDPAGGPSGSLVLLEDVTDLMRKNQLEAWAEMARAIAHEIKNPLTPIQLSTEHLDRLLRDRGIIPSDELESCLKNIIRQVRALRQIAGEFSAYAKLPDLEFSPTDPVAFLKETVAPYKAGPPPGIEIVEHYQSCPEVSLDTRVLARAFVNLTENALQSMPDGGILTVESKTEADGAIVHLTVRDTGRGISPDVRARLFEPYFSTRSSGTGLGLAIVLRSVVAHGGSIDVESVEGEGTAFHIRLPAGRMPKDPDGGKQDPASGIAGGHS